jgi:hypothetical protein
MVTATLDIRKMYLATPPLYLKIIWCFSENFIFSWFFTLQPTLMHEFYFSELKGLRAWIGADQQESIFPV